VHRARAVGARATHASMCAAQGYQLLNCDDHATFLRKHGKDPALYRPDIAHQALLAILDSPLAKSGRLKARGAPRWRAAGPGQCRACKLTRRVRAGAVRAHDAQCAGAAPRLPFMVQTEKCTFSWLSVACCCMRGWIAACRTTRNSSRAAGGAQVQVNPQVRLPRTFKRFCGLMVQLLQKLSIRATNGPDKLLKVGPPAPGRGLHRVRKRSLHHCVPARRAAAGAVPGCGPWLLRSLLQSRLVCGAARSRPAATGSVPPAVHAAACVPCTLHARVCVAQCMVHAARHGITLGA